MTPGSIETRISRRMRAEVFGALPHAQSVRQTQRRLEETGGGYEIVHASPGIEIGVYVLVAPEPDRQEAHEDDEIYIVLDGEGSLTIGTEERPVKEDDLIFVPAHADHRFTGYVGLTVLVVFSRVR